MRAKRGFAKEVKAALLEFRALQRMQTHFIIVESCLTVRNGKSQERLDCEAEMAKLKARIDQITTGDWPFQLPLP